MNLIIDIGNTRVKIAFFDKNTLVEKAILKTLTLDELSTVLKGQNIQSVIMSVSGQETEGVEQWLSEKFHFIKLNHSTPIPIENNYGTPETLGKDRLAAVIAANYLYPNSHNLVIDSGTCITYNFINKNAEFIGGNIAPGLNMRLKAMHHFTARLPLLERNTEGVIEGGFIGQSTQQAMLNGAQIGLVAEVEGWIHRFKKHFGELNIILTGGDGAFLYRHISIEKINYEPNLVLIGLNQILNFNKK